VAVVAVLKERLQVKLVQVEEQEALENLKVHLHLTQQVL
jgi:hypothetical protein